MGRPRLYWSFHANKNIRHSSRSNQPFLHFLSSTNKEQLKVSLFFYSKPDFLAPSNSIFTVLLSSKQYLP